MQETVIYCPYCMGENVTVTCISVEEVRVSMDELPERPEVLALALWNEGAFETPAHDKFEAHCQTCFYLREFET